MKSFYRCRCYYTHNYYSNILRGHFTFVDREQFLGDYKEVLKPVKEGDIEKIFKELENEQTRRYNTDKMSSERKHVITNNYKPLHKHIYTLKEEFFSPAFLDLLSYCKSEKATKDGVLEKIEECSAERVYRFQVFSKQFCEEFLEELDHFQASGLPIGKPNTMNNYGILLNELNFDEGFITPFRELYLQPLIKILYPEWTGKQLDSHKAFTVHYELQRDRSLDYHYDNAEVTLNVCLGKEFDEGTLYFGSMRTESHSELNCTEVCHEVGYGIIHRGQHLHGAMPIQDGVRVNLIIWLRSSEVRNKLCPMCDCIPDLIEVDGFGDGFTKNSDNSCNVG